MTAVDPVALRRVGVVERFPPGQYQHVEDSLQRLRACHVNEMRVPVPDSEYCTSDGQAWYDWLLPGLAREVAVLPCIDHAPAVNGTEVTLASPAGMIAARHWRLFRTIEFRSGPDELRDPGWSAANPALCREIRTAISRVQQHGFKVVLGIPCLDDLIWLRMMGENGILELADILGLRTFPETDDHRQDWHGLIRQVRDITGQFNAHPAIWITETGCSSGQHDSLAQVQAFRAAAAAPAERFYWDSLQDAAASLQPGRQTRQSGLYTATGEPKLLARLLAAGGPAHVSQVARLAHPTILSSRPVLITGGAGFIGSNLAERLVQEGHDVLIYDSLARPGVEENVLSLQQAYPGRISVAIADIRDESAIADTAADASAVFHFAAQVAVTTSMTDPQEDFAVNAGGTLALLEAIRHRSPSPPLIFASTNKVYGNLADITLDVDGDRYMPSSPDFRSFGISEDRMLDFHTPYGCSKGSADQYVLDYCHSFGVPTAVLRMSCIYGRRQRGTEDQGWVAHFLLRGLAGDPITIYGDGRQVRDVLWVDDAVDAYMAAWKRIGAIQGKAFNLGGGPANAVSLLQVVAEMETILGRRLETRFASWRPGDQRYFVADRRRVEQALRLPSPLDWRSGLVRLMEWFTCQYPVQSSILGTNTIEVHA